MIVFHNSPYTCRKIQQRLNVFATAFLNRTLLNLQIGIGRILLDHTMGVKEGGVEGD